MKTKTKLDTCCMCGNETDKLIRRNDGDDYCPKCHNHYCEHLHQKTVWVSADETVAICLDCEEDL